MRQKRSVFYSRGNAGNQQIQDRGLSRRTTAKRQPDLDRHRRPSLSPGASDSDGPGLAWTGWQGGHPTVGRPVAAQPETRGRLGLIQGISGIFESLNDRRNSSVTLITYRVRTDHVLCSEETCQFGLNAA